MTDYKKVRYYLRDFSIDYGHLAYVLYPYAHMYNAGDIVRDIKSAFLVSVEMQITPTSSYRIECKFESPSEFLDFERHIHVRYEGRVFSDFSDIPRKYIDFQVPTTSEMPGYKEFIVDRLNYKFDRLNNVCEIEITPRWTTDGIGLIDCIKYFYPNAQFRYELSYTSPTIMHIEISEADGWNFVHRAISVYKDGDRCILIRFNYDESDIAATKQMMNERYGIASAKIKDYYPGYTYTPRQESQPKYFVVSSEGYSPIRCLPYIPNCVWPEQTFKQTETKTLKAGDVMTFDYKIDDSTIYPHVDIKEEKDMAGYKLKDASSKLKLYMVEDKPTYTPRGMVRGTAHNVEELPEAIRKVQFNEKKGFVTVVWTDGVVSFAKCGPNDVWDPEKGLAIAIMKRWFKSTTSMNKWIKNTIPEDTDPVTLFQGLIRKAFGVKDDLSPEEKAYCDKDAEAVTEAVESKEKDTESDRAEMLEKYESVKEENK